MRFGLLILSFLLVSCSHSQKEASRLPASKKLISQASPAQAPDNFLGIPLDEDEIAEGMEEIQSGYIDF